MPRSAQQLAHQRIQSQSLHTLDFMHVRAGGLTLHARHAPICASKGDPAKMVMGREAMAALLSSVALIARRRRDVIGT